MILSVRYSYSLVLLAFIGVSSCNQNSELEKEINRLNFNVNVERFDKFVEGLKDKQIAVVSVKGMVCDFCAQGIEKTFKKDKTVAKIDVDLNKGKVFIAYQMNTKIDFEKIKKMIISNGQNATKLQVLKL